MSQSIHNPNVVGSSLVSDFSSIKFYLYNDFNNRSFHIACLWEYRCRFRYLMSKLEVKVARKYSVK